MERVLEQQLLAAGKVVEDHIDKEIQRLDELATNEDDLEALRERRLRSIKDDAIKKQEWRANGHGAYSELADEKDFFQACKRSKNVVCHFFRPSTHRCQIVDKHFEVLAIQHLETRFVKINVERCVFLAERLRIVVIPTIGMIIDDKVAGYIVGFDDFGGTDDFPTAMVEWRLAHAKIINYAGDLSTPPISGKKATGILGIPKTRSVRSKRDESDDSD